MHVKDDRLHEDDGSAVRFVASPHHSEGFQPRMLIVHYTASLTLQSTVGWFQEPRAAVSSHVIVDRDGEVVQMVPFNRRAWHAGKSRWGDLENLNACAIGLELVNAGALDRLPSGDWVDWAKHRIPERDVMVASHKHEARERGWHVYPEIQLARALEVARALHAPYGFTDVLGHDDVAPDRKVDPGPAFPMARFAAAVLGHDAALAQALGR
jgi:N-acetylmuramoyl-L-alanine amidase